MKIISFVNMKGGVGKTTLSVNIADFLHKRYQKKVLFIDIDPQFNATQCLLTGDEYVEYLNSKGTTIIDVFDSVTKLTMSTVKGSGTKEPTSFDEIRPYKNKRGFDLVPSQLDLFRYEMAPGQGTEFRLKNYLQYLKEKSSYDICIIDSPPTPSVWMSSALIASDYYLIPVKPDPISMTGLDLLEGIIKEKKENYGCQCKCCGIVLNVVEQHTIVFNNAYDYFSKNDKWQKHLYAKSIPKRVKVANGQLNNMFIYDINDAMLKGDFSGIVQEFLNRIGETQ